jgi:hypothetical protein
MRDETNNQVHRRTFLKVSSASVAVLVSRPLLTEFEAVAELPARGKPVDPVVLRSSKLELVLDRKDGLPYEYRLLPDNERIRGEDFGALVAATICNRARWEFRTSALTAPSVKATANRADFQFHAADPENPATPSASFVVRYVLDGATVTITLEDIQEHEGYELIEVALPRLATVCEDDGPAWLAHGEDGGSVAALNEATPGHLPSNTFWGNVLATLPVVMIGTDRAICIQEVSAYMDGTELTVAGENGHRRGSLGTVKTHRINGSLGYDMNTGPGTPRNCGNPQTPNLLVEQKSSCRLDFISAGKSGGGVDWLDAAKLVRKRMPAIPTRYYDNKIVYGIRCDEPRFEKPSATFDECDKLIRDVAALTDRSPQVVHLWGWQYHGKDTGYPAVAEVNARIGGYDRMMRLLGESRALNCTVTLSDNYDDAYKSSPEWDEAVVARRPDGELWKSRNWTGEDSYVLGMAKYVAGPGLARAKYTCERYKLRETTHVDVLSYFPIRNDWDPRNSASGIKNLAARFNIVDEFARHGVDVSSEALRYPFIGKMSCFWYMQGPRPCPFGGKPIPLLPTVYRQSAVWGGQAARGCRSH